MKAYSEIDFKRLKREAKKLSKATGIPHTDALNKLAHREGYANWALFYSRAKRSDESATVSPLISARSTAPLLGQADVIGLKPSTSQSFEKSVEGALLEFMELLDADEVSKLCKNGSIWIDLNDVRNDVVEVSSFEIMGPTYDSRVVQYGREVGAVCLVDFDGLADSFVFQNSINVDGKEFDLVPNDVAYSEESGRKALMECVASSIEAEFDNLFAALDD